MTYRDRYQKTIQHLSPDRTPLDICGTALTSVSDAFLANLMQHINQSASDRKSAIEIIQRRYDIDFRHVGDVLKPHNSLETRSDSKHYTDCWGIEYAYSGLYWEISRNPLRNASLADMKKYPWPEASQIDRQDLNDIEEQAKHYYHDTDYVVVASHPVYGYFELGCWLFGFDDFMLKMAVEPESADWFMNRYHRYVIDVIDQYYGRIGKYIHLTTSGDDFGTQNGPFVSPSMFQEMIAPWYEKRIKATKSLFKGQYFHHSCGSVYRLLGLLIDAGVDILNPIQPGCIDMDPLKLKQEFGREIVFWGGIDEQNLLTHSKPEEIKQEVLRIYNILSKDGGYILSASHNIQPDVPPENIEAMFMAILNQ
jgi:uroporphyrinogen decarboxylase